MVEFAAGARVDVSVAVTMHSPRILVFAGSIRTGAFSQKLAAHVARELKTLGADVNLISLADYSMPVYDADLEVREGVPSAAKNLRRAMTESQGIYIATPEYNASIPPLLKNSIDWVSRAKEPAANPFKECTFTLGATSDGRFGGYRALIALRQVLELGLGALVLPQQVAINAVASAFDDNGALTDERNGKILRASLDKLLAAVGARV